jgi:hypothetical protein
MYEALRGRLVDCQQGFAKGRLSLWAQRFADDIANVINGKYVSTVCELMQKALFIVQTWCRGVIGKTWGLKPQVVYWIYTSVVRRCLTYAALLWWKKASQISVNQK